MYKSYNVTLKTIGPLHIGSGQKLAKFDYIIDNGVIYVIDPAKMFKGLKKLGLVKAFEKSVMERSNLFNFVKSYNISSNEYRKWSIYSYRLYNYVDIKSMQIMTCVKDPYNMPYIPGSSLKGALRNAVLNYELMKSYREDIADSVEMGMQNNSSKKYYLKNDSENADKIFRTHNLENNEKPTVTNDIFKGLRVSDSKPLKTEDIILCQKVDITPDGVKNSINCFRECIKPGVNIEFQIDVDDNVLKYDTDGIINAVKAFYNKQISCFLSKFKNISSDNKTGNFIYIGGGSGFVSKTAVYSLFHNEDKALKAASVILDTVDSTNKGKKVGNHLEDPYKFGVAPHMRKCTMYNNSLYDFGLCVIDFKPIV